VMRTIVSILVFLPLAFVSPLELTPSFCAHSLTSTAVVVASLSFLSGIDLQ
jgi:hypothetical protein